MKKIALLLSGCGHRDGSEITEAVSLLIGLTQAGAFVQCYAPNITFHPVNHLSGERSSHDSRSTLTEAARIARGQVKDLSSLRVQDYDAFALCGGFGAATLLSNWAVAGAQCTVLPELSRAIEGFYKEKKPIGAVCIAPVLLAKVLGKHGISLTIGADKETALEIHKTGAQHIECPVTDYVSDRDHRILTAPAYMYSAKPFEVFNGIQRLCRELVEWA